MKAVVRAKALNTYHGLKLAIFLRKDEDIGSKNPYQVENITFSPIWKALLDDRPIVHTSPSFPFVLQLRINNSIPIMKNHFRFC